MELKPLTRKQARVLNYIVAEVEEGNGPPTIREIGAKFKMSSTGSVRDVLNALTRKGYVVHRVGKARGRKLNPEVFSITLRGKSKIRLKSGK